MDSAAWDARYAGAELVWSVEPNVFVARECADLEPGRALDLGCGEGRNALWLAERGWDVTAVDFSSVALTKARRLAAEAGTGHRVTWQQGDATSWRGTGFDLALIVYLQLPAPERRLALRAAWEALSPGGTLVLVAHDATNLTEGVGGPQDPAVLISAADVLADLDLADLDERRSGPLVRHADRVRREIPGSAPAWDCLVRLEHP